MEGMFEEQGGIKTGIGQIHKVAVMSEEDHLGPEGKFRQCLQGGAGALVIEVDQNVVHNERHRFAGVEAILQ